MKKYITPELVLNQVMTSHIIATSLPILEEEVTDGFVKEPEGLDLWKDLGLF